MGLCESKQSVKRAASPINSMTRDTELSRPVRRVSKNILIFWLDSNLNESSEDFRNSVKCLQGVADEIKTFKDTKECIAAIRKIENMKILMIVSESLGRQIIPEIQHMPQLESFYIISNNKSQHGTWDQNIPKIKGIYTTIEPICEALQMDGENRDRNMVELSFDGMDHLFMYTQLLKQTFLEIEDDNAESIKELIDYCRLQDDVPESQLVQVELEYCDHSPIWWYTAPYFVYSMLNRGLRIMDTDIVLKMGFFIRHLHNSIVKLHQEQQVLSKRNANSSLCVFYWQGLSLEDFEKLKEKRSPGVISFNHFLWTSSNREKCVEHARQEALKCNSYIVGVLFVLTIDLVLCEKLNIPYADIKNVSYYKTDEAQILFTTHTIHRIVRIEKIHDDETDNLWEIQLTLLGNNNNSMSLLTEYLRKELSVAKGWLRLCQIFRQIGESGKAQRILHTLLSKPCSDDEKAIYCYQLGMMHRDLGEYSEALSYFQKDLTWKEKSLSPNHSDLASSYTNVGLVYADMGEYSEALEHYEKALEVRKIHLPPNHPEMATNYNQIGYTYCKMGEFSRALSYYEKELEIRKISLPPNHPDLVSSYNNIGLVYDNMGEFSKALSYYEKALEVRKISLPPNHPDLASSYNNIGLVYDNMGEFSKALSYYEKALEVRKISLPPNHPDLASSYNNIGLVYDNMGEFSKALSYYEKAQSIFTQSLPLNHPYHAQITKTILDVKKKL